MAQLPVETYSVTGEETDLVGSATLVAVTVTTCCAVIVAGTRYTPFAFTEPTLGLIVQVTASFGLRFTLAANSCVPQAFKFWLEGLRLIVKGPNVTGALADLVGSIVLVAVTVTTVVAGITTGAVYSPVLLIVPTLGLIDQVTLVVCSPTKALNCCVPVAKRFWLDGDNAKFWTMLDTCKFNGAEASFVESATLVAVTVTVCAVLITGGAV